MLSIFSFFNIFSTNNIEKTFWKKCFFFFISFIVYNILLIASVLLIKNIDNIISILGYESVIQQIKNTNTEINTLSLWKIIVLIPLLEEVAFRLYLDTDKYNIILSVFALSFLIIYGNFVNIVISFWFFISIVLSIILSYIAYIYNKKISYFIIKNKNKFILLNIISFGLFHLSNIEHIELSIIFLYVFFVLPQIILGYLITNLRIKMGFIWGVLFHSMINLMGSVL